MIPLRWTYAGDAGKRLGSDEHFILPTPSVTPELKKNEKKQADFENLGGQAAGSSRDHPACDGASPEAES
jgi:hypothetical protein